MNDREFDLARYFLEDNQKLIAAGKIQRWDIVKWGVTVNLALAAAAISLRRAGDLFFYFSAFVAWLAWAMAVYHDSKITRARKNV